jgi:hypothetical protein
MQSTGRQSRCGIGLADLLAGEFQIPCAARSERGAAELLNALAAQALLF